MKYFNTTLGKYKVINSMGHPITTLKGLLPYEFQGHLEQNQAKKWFQSKQQVSCEIISVKGALWQPNFMSNLHESIYYFQKILLSSLRAYWMFLNMFVSKSPCCHKIFIFSELLHNLILIKWNMVGKNNELFSERRERRFSMESENRTCRGLKLPLFLSKIHLLHVPLPRKFFLLTRLFGTVQLKKLNSQDFIQDEWD